jgi:uncharacterized membrane protein
MLINSFLNAMKEGKELANAATWKNRTIAASVITAFLSSAVSIAGGLGYDIQVDQNTLQEIGGGVTAIVALFSAVMHVVTSAKVGLPSETISGSDTTSNAGGE